MPNAEFRTHLPVRSRHDARIGRLAALVRIAASACMGLLLATAPHGTKAAEGSALRGLRAPPLIDFGALDAYRFGIANTFVPDAEAQSSSQPSPLYGFRERRQRDPRAQPDVRLSYSYSDNLTGVVETGAVPLDPYASTYAVAGQIVRSFDSGLGVGLGLRQKPAGDNVLAIAVQQEWGPFRGGYTLYSGRSDIASSPGHRFALNFDYGTRSSIGLSYTARRDLAPGMPPSAMYDTRALALSGSHWLAPQWALTYDVVNSDQAAYRRQGLRFGIRHTF